MTTAGIQTCLLTTRTVAGQFLSSQVGDSSKHCPISADICLEINETCVNDLVNTIPFVSMIW